MRRKKLELEIREMMTSLKNRREVLSSIQSLEKAGKISRTEMMVGLYITDRAFDAYCRDGETGLEEIAYADIMAVLKREHGVYVTEELIDDSLFILVKNRHCRFVTLHMSSPDTWQYRGLPVLIIDTREYVTNMHEL